MAELGNKELSSRVIEAAIAVHTALGPGFIESVYESALCVELAARGIGFERQKTIKIHHLGVEVGEHRLDVPVANEGGWHPGWPDPEFCRDAAYHQTHRPRFGFFLIS